MTAVLNFIAGPGAGKSGTAAGVFAELKGRGLEVELVTEYAKEIMWEAPHLLYDGAFQFKVFSTQAWYQARVRDKVDIIVTDAPLILGLAYMDQKTSAYKHYRALVEIETAKYDNLYFQIQRGERYSTTGRKEAVDEAIQIDTNVNGIMADLGVKFYKVQPGDTRTILDILEVNDAARYHGR